jgi:hypothetical protein
MFSEDVRGSIPRAGTGWMDIRDAETGKLLMRYCPSKGVIEVRSRGKVYMIVLADQIRQMQEKDNEHNKS